MAKTTYQAPHHDCDTTALHHSGVEDTDPTNFCSSAAYNTAHTDIAFTDAQRHHFEQDKELTKLIQEFAAVDGTVREAHGLSCHDAV